MMTKVNSDDIRNEEAVPVEEDKETEKTAEDEKKDIDGDMAQEEKTDEKDRETEEDKDKAEEKPTDAEPEKEESDARYLRLMADFQNYKKRVEKEKKDLYSYANEKIIIELLSVLDNFERALEQETEGDGFKEGMEMIFKQLGDVLEKSGLAEIAALGEDFDPNFHNAVMTEETEEYESGKVSGVMQKGYTLNGKVIRPSMVKVAG
ncbi:MAG: nucleotide exchange factor GrpE [Anaerovoracaceae bacterium]